MAIQFMEFWSNFVDTFDLTGYKVYIVGESYAGMYVPYIASNSESCVVQTCFDSFELTQRFAVLDANNTDYYDVSDT